MSNNGLLGFPGGNNIMDAASQAIYAGSVGGVDLHYVNVPVTPDSLDSGFVFRYTPTQVNTGPVQIIVNGAGPFDLMKAQITQFGDNGGATMQLQAGDIVPGRSLVVMCRRPGTTYLFEILSGLNIQFTATGVSMAKAADAAAGRAVLGLGSGAITNVGTAATRNVGTGLGNLPQVVDGAGNLDSSLNVAQRELDNLVTAGLQRVLWASIAFTGAGAVIAAFNASVVRNSVGLYTITWGVGAFGTYNVIPVMDVAPSSSGTNCNVVSGSRTGTSAQITCRTGNSSVDPFDPDRVTASVFAVA